jgi:hypothetical protein
MVAVAPNVTDATIQAATNENKQLTPKQQKRLEEQKAREAKKMAKRQERALQKERKAAEKEHKEEERQRRMEELQVDMEGKTPKEVEEEQRRKEEEELFQKEFGIMDDEPKSVPHTHVKKSALDSNRLGGTHMA